MAALGSESQNSIQHVSETFRPLCEDLVRMPVRGHHYGCYADDEILWNVRVKEVTHGIYENHAWPRPREGLYQFIWYKAQIEAPLIRVPLYSSEALSECLGITELAPWTDLRASADGIPCRIGPFNR